MSCSNCFNGCTDIKSDQCIKYTGIDVPVLGILKGDSLSYVEQALITFLTSTLDGSGIVPTITEADICALVDGYLVDCEDITLNNIITALLKATCNLQEQITDVVEDLTALEGSYTVGCLTGVTASSGTHAILQAVITKLCANETTLTALALNLTTNYASTGAQLNAQIQAYLDSIAASDLVSNKMIPYTAMEYYGPLTNFDATGAGTGLWDKIYLCNGENGTPDKRGRVGIGCTNMLGTVALDVEVDPANPNNPTYSLTSPGVSTKGGANVITLSAAQMPIHTHTATSTPTVTAHTHYTVHSGITDISITNATPIRYTHTGESYQNYTLKGTEGTADLGLTSATTVGVTIATTNANAGSSSSHSNIQPVIACYYIIFIP